MIRKKELAAYCGDCGNVFMRADLASFNVKVWIPGEPEDSKGRSYRLRLCRSCSVDMVEDLEVMAWDNDMFDPPEDVRSCDWSDGWTGIEDDLKIREEEEGA